MPSASTRTNKVKSEPSKMCDCEYRTDTDITDRSNLRYNLNMKILMNTLALAAIAIVYRMDLSAIELK